MSLFKRSTSRNWYYRIYTPSRSKVIQGSTGTSNKAKAREFHDRLKADLWDQTRLGHKPDYTWNEAVVRYLEERAEIGSLDTTKKHLRWLDPHLDSALLTSIDRVKIDAIARAKKQEEVVVRTKQGPKPVGRKVSAGTVNRLIGVLNAVLNAAVDWEWIHRAPKRKRLKTAAKRIRWLTPAQAKTLIAVLPKHLADMAQLSLETGLRRANVTGLQWSQIDLDRRIAWIHPDQAKARKAIAVPLSDTAIEVIKRQQWSKRHPDFTQSVFVYEGRPVYQTSTAAWRKGLAKAGIKDFRWHDLRHTWASWHVQRGTPIQVLKELGGWETMEMVQRYAHLAAEHLTRWVVPMTHLAAIDCNLTAPTNVVELKSAVSC